MTKRAALLLGLVVLWCLPAEAADRMTDRDVKALVSRIEQGRDRFDDALDGKLKHEIVRGPSGEVDVARFLDDFQKSIDNLEERLKPEYAASTEAADLLRRGSSIDAFFHQQPPGTKGESEWNRLASDLQTLATAYGTRFPLPEHAAVRRIGDRELAAAIEHLAETGSQLKKSLDTDLKKDPGVDKATRARLVGEADGFSKDAKDLRDRVKDGKPSSAEAERLLGLATTLQTSITSHQAPASRSLWTSATPHVQTLASAYRVSSPEGK
ncbi:MAG TPA: hypothetical protein VH458_12295 [Vicinamibacterales bacterium]|jgi:hypothetical protein